MTWLIVLLIVILLAGIILLNRETQSEEKSREQFLKNVEKFVYGHLEPMENQLNSFRVPFDFEGKEFIYEDLLVKGFKENVNKGYLKAKTHSKLILYFTQKEPKTSIRGDIFIASEIPDERLPEDIKVETPKGLESFKVHTNDPVLTNELFGDPRIVRILTDFKNKIKGTDLIPLRISEGVVILEFFPFPNLKPNLFSLHSNVSAMEDYLLLLARIVEKIDGRKSKD